MFVFRQWLVVRVCDQQLLHIYNLFADILPSRSDWRMLFEHSFLWHVSYYYLVTMLVKTTIETWMQLYLIENEQMSDASAMQFLYLLEIGGFVGSLASGIVSDMLSNYRQQSSIRARLHVGCASMCLILIAVFIMQHRSVIIILSYISTIFQSLFYIASPLMGIGVYSCINVFGLLGTELAPNRVSGTSYAIVSLASNIGAVLAGYPLGCVLTIYDYSGLFVILHIQLITCIILIVFKCQSDHFVITDNKHL